MPSKKRKTAFVMAGGGSLAAVQVGMLKAVTASGVFPDFLVGSSVGAINAAFFATDPTYRGAVRLENIWKNIKRQDIFQIDPIGGLMSLLSCRYSICTVKPLARLLKAHQTIQTFEQANIPFHVVATDLFNGNEVVFSKGKLITTLLASSAVPAVFPPVKMDGYYLVDGGLTNNTPISVAVAKGAKRVIIFPTGMSCSLREPPRGIIEISLQTLNMAVSHRLMSDIEKYKDEAEIILLPVLCPLEVSIFNFSKTAELIERAQQKTEDWISKFGMAKQHHMEILKPHYH